MQREIYYRKSYLKSQRLVGFVLAAASLLVIVAGLLSNTIQDNVLQPLIGLTIAFAAIRMATDASRKLKSDLPALIANLDGLSRWPHQNPSKILKWQDYNAFVIVPITTKRPRFSLRLVLKNPMNATKKWSRLRRFVLSETVQTHIAVASISELEANYPQIRDLFVGYLPEIESRQWEKVPASARLEFGKSLIDQAQPNIDRLQTIEDYEIAYYNAHTGVWEAIPDKNAPQHGDSKVQIHFRQDGHGWVNLGSGEEPLFFQWKASDPHQIQLSQQGQIRHMWHTLPYRFEYHDGEISLRFEFNTDELRDGASIMNLLKPLTESAFRNMAISGDPPAPESASPIQRRT